MKVSPQSTIPGAAARVGFQGKGLCVCFGRQGPPPVCVPGLITNTVFCSQLAGEVGGEEEETDMALSP